MGIDATGSGEFSASAALHADPPVQSATRVEYPDRVFELARIGINWLAPMPLGSDRQPDTVRFKVQHADLGSRKRTAVLDEDAGLTRPRGPERIQPENCNMEPARSRRTGILQVKEFSTGKGIKPPIEARFLQVKEKRQRVSPTAPRRLEPYPFIKRIGPQRSLEESTCSTTNQGYCSACECELAGSKFAVH
jgi:hypothetical protein